MGGFQGRAATPEFDGGPAVGELYGRPEPDRSDARRAATGDQGRPAEEQLVVRERTARSPAGAPAGDPPDGSSGGDPRAGAGLPDSGGGREARGAAGPVRKLLVPFVTGGVTEDWLDYLLAMQAAGADAIEVGLPFSDPMLDGVTIQQSTGRALARGATIGSILREVRDARDRLHIPLIAFTYANLVFRPGPAAFCRQLAEAGFRGLIVPDLPLDEAAEVERAAAAAGIELTLLVAPVTPDDRLAEIVARSRGYLYAISHMGTTGERASLASSAAVLAARIKAAQVTATAGVAGPVPVLIGFGISGVEQAVEAGRAGDGVVVGAALMRRVLDGATPREIGDYVAALRAALDTLDQEASADRAAHAEVSGDRR
ncbi:tryptophan synthase subunit alpha [Paractinoplanes maris]|uniref:tryptophan synthase subunit alpha n=1 Tax=Paractinoplanes maris TaxID=1734446 RepID=UPI0027E12B37|nr:tryptophan synthase subunit alpha [Actinoplanes maris]